MSKASLSNLEYYSGPFFGCTAWQCAPFNTQCVSACIDQFLPCEWTELNRTEPNPIHSLSLLWKGRKLESFLGHWGFMRTCFDLLLLSHLLTLCLSWGIYHYHDYTPINMGPFKDAYQECFIGLNPMLFALKVSGGLSRRKIEVCSCSCEIQIQ